MLFHSFPSTFSCTNFRLRGKIHSPTLIQFNQRAHESVSKDICGYPHSQWSRPETMPQPRQAVPGGQSTKENFLWQTKKKIDAQSAGRGEGDGWVAAAQGPRHWECSGTLDFCKFSIVVPVNSRSFKSFKKLSYLETKPYSRRRGLFLFFHRRTSIRLVNGY